MRRAEERQGLNHYYLVNKKTHLYTYIPKQNGKGMILFYMANKYKLIIILQKWSVFIWLRYILKTNIYFYMLIVES